jgi:hypothetical protein
MTSAADAIAKAKGTFRWAVGMCDNFVANMYGYSSSGYSTALVNWNSTPSGLKHPGDPNAPAGALMFWDGGDGHVAISLGNGSIISTDISGNGTVSTVPASAISDKWGKRYLGWSYPYFQGHEATNTLGGITGSTSTATGTNAVDAGLLSATVNPDKLAKGFLEAIAKPFETLLGTVAWGVETLIGLALVVVGLRLIMLKGELPT